MSASRNAASHGSVADSPYSWVRLGICLILSTIGGIGLWSSIIVLPYVELEFGVDRGGASFPYAASMIGFAVGGILMGRMVDRFGITVPVMLGAVMLGAGYILSAYVTNLWAFVACQAVLVGMLGSSATFSPMVADVSHWFVRRRGIAVAIVASGNYLAGAIWSPVLQQAVEVVGWRDALFWSGVFCVVTMIPLTLFLRRRPEIDQGNAPTRSAHYRGGGDMPVSPRAMMIILSFAGIACCVAMSMPQVHIKAYCGDLGYGLAVGAEMLSLMLGLGIVSRLISGLIADRIGGLGTLILGSTLQCMALIFYLPFDGLVSLYVISAMFGLAQGGIVPSYALIVRDYFPAREAGTRVGIVLMATVVGMALGGWMSGEIYDLTGSYQAAFLNGIVWNFLNMSIALWLLMHRSGNRPMAAA